MTDSVQQQKTIRIMLIGIFVMGFALRAAAAFSYSVHYPDEIFQTLEPAHRLLFGYGTVTWEYREGIRSFLPSIILAGPMWLGDKIAPTSALVVNLPRLMMAFLSLSLIWSGWMLGRRISQTHGLIAAAVAAVWVEFISFAPHTLTEQLATIIIIPAIILASEKSPTLRQLIFAGFLFGLGVVLRPHYAPTVGIAVILLAKTDWRGRWLPMIGGGIIAVLIEAGVDIAMGQYPFEWLVLNYKFNIIHDVASRYGVMPWSYYLGGMGHFWSLFGIVIILLARQGLRNNYALAAAIIVTFLVHSFIGHKEYRFILLTTAALALLAAIGTGEVAQWISKRAPNISKNIIVIALIGMWLVASLWRWPAYRDYDTAAVPLFAMTMDQERKDPAMCGVAVVGRYFAEFHAYSRIHRPVPLLVYEEGSTFVEPDRFSHAVVQENYKHLLPPSFKQIQCTYDAQDGKICSYKRAGTCNPAPSEYEMNRLLKRTER